jgi:hypothetical protein
MNDTCLILLRWGDIALLRSFWFLRGSQPPVETGGYKDFAPTEQTGGAALAKFKVEAF